MRRLPLFVLPVVLFPGMVLPLHVFEPRYRRMAARCLESDKRFGLIFHDAERAGDFAVTPGDVGCVAEIRQFRPLPDGRSLMLTIGEERFQVQDGIDNDSGYHEAVVTEYADTDSRLIDMVPRRKESVALFARVVKERFGTTAEDVDTAHDVSFVLAEAIMVTPAWQQRLLEMRTERARLDEIDMVLATSLGSGGQLPPP